MMKHIYGSAQTIHNPVPLDERVRCKIAHNGSIIDEDALQPNAIDLRLKKVWKLEATTFSLDEGSKLTRNRTEEYVYNDGYFHLWPGAYEIQLGETIHIGMNEAGFVIPRSTLVRNGCFIVSGLYDSGYEGCMLACLHVTSSLFKVKPETRLAQFLVFEAESLKKYDGQYQGEKR